MNMKQLAQIAREQKILVHEPFAEFLHASSEESRFEISLLDCYRLAGHACHAITGAFLCTQLAVRELFPNTNVCERGDITVEFGAESQERASGPKSNVISYITGAWGDSGFAGLKGQFVRKNLVSFGRPSLAKNAIRFKRPSNGHIVSVEYDPSAIVSKIKAALAFPDNWRQEIRAVLLEPEAALKFQNELPNGCQTGFENRC